MDSGKILVAEHNGVHSIKLVGDVRVTVCCEFDAYLQQTLAKNDYRSCIIDLTEAENLDSTMLGLVAKVAVASSRANKDKPTIMAPTKTMQRLLCSMSFDKVFNLETVIPDSDNSLIELDHLESSESEIRTKVIDAHRVLMGICSENNATFSSLVEALENEQRQDS